MHGRATLDQEACASQMLGMSFAIGSAEKPSLGQSPLPPVELRVPDPDQSRLRPAVDALHFC
jgi:hypothetical protein